MPFFQTDAMLLSLRGTPNPTGRERTFRQGLDELVAGFGEPVPEGR
jgi:hypothetical protein